MSDIDMNDNARSKAGHAAFSMRGTDDKWVLIQLSTFTNWVNEQLREQALTVEDLRTDFCDGIKLCALMEHLQKRKIGKIVKRPINQHQFLENCNIALNAIKKDKIKLVNIGSEDIVNGNLKLILGMIWHLILRYQIGKASKVPPKKLMLSWLNAVMPDLTITNFNSNWNDGVALHALIDYCRPGTSPDWQNLNKADGLQNCRSAMQLAKQYFGIPLVLSPENLSSPDLDELSGMTYLSYFMKIESPGYHATLNWVRDQIPDQNVGNFQTDWNDGKVLGSLVTVLGGKIPGWPSMDPNDHTANVKNAMGAASSQLDVTPVISAKELSDPEVDHLGVMAYAAWFQHLNPRRAPRSPTPPPPMPVRAPEPPPQPVPRRIIMEPAEALELTSITRATKTKQRCTFTLEMRDEEVDPSKVQFAIQGPSTNPPVNLSWHGNKAVCEFTPIESGQHRVLVYNQGELVRGCPADVTVSADASQFSLVDGGLSSATLGQSSAIRINAKDAERGLVKVEATSPSGRTSDMGVIDTNGIYTANFTPTEVGDWRISIFYDNQHIHGSPFSVRVYDAAQVKVFGLEGGMVGKNFSFSADTSAAGEGQLTVDISHQGRTIPVHIREEGRGLYKVNFTPPGPGIYTIRVYFANMEVTGSPYTLEIVDSTKVTAAGDGLTNAEVGKRSSFIVNTHGATGGDLVINVTSPRGTNVPTQVINQGDGTYRVDYTASEVGEYLIDVSYYGQPIKGSPWRIQSYDFGRIAVKNLRGSGMVGRQCEFDIEATHAGNGNLEIMVNEGTIPCSVQSRGNRMFHATFTPRESIPHVVSLKFNGREIKGSPWTVEVKSVAHVTASGPGFQLIPVHRPTYFEVRGGNNDAVVTCNITSPSRRVVPSKIVNNYNGSHRVEFSPNECGNYIIEVLYDGMAIPGSPFSTKAFDSSAITVSKIGNAIVGRASEFTIDVTQAGEGQLEIMVNKGQVQNSVKMLRKGVFLVSFVPKSARTHEVDIKFNGEILPNCPIQVPVLDASRVTVHGEGLHQVAVNKSSFFRVNTASAGEADLSVRVTSPSGRENPVRLSGSPQSGFEVNFNATEVGTHRIDLDYADNPIPGSPFYVNSYDSSKVQVQNIQNGFVGKTSSFIGSPYSFNVSDASKITANGEGLTLAACRSPASFNIEGPRIRANDLQVLVTDMAGRSMHASLRDITEGRVQAEWSPADIGDHRLEIMYQGQHINGSPYTAKVWDAGQVKVQNPGQGMIGKPYYFTIDASRAGAGSLEIIVSVRGENVPNFVKMQDNARFEVSFTPNIADTHNISVKFNGTTVPGSPFVAEIEDLARILQLENGLMRIPLGRPATVSLNPGKAREIAHTAIVEIIAPSNKVGRAKVDWSNSHTLQAVFVPAEVGPHCLNVTVGDVEIPGSPFACEVYDVRRVKLGLADRGIVGKPYQMDVDTNPAGNGELEIIIKQGSKRMPVKIVDKGSGIFKCFFLPKEPGVHQIYVFFSKETVPGSPFSVLIEDTTHVVATGRCLEASPIGELASFSIDPTKAPFKANAVIKILSALPDRYEMRFHQTGSYFEGWTIEWMPEELGVHTIEVKYGDSHIVGSPFRCRVYDLSKVKIIRDEGSNGINMNGLHMNGLPGQQRCFFVDASEAGAGNLEVIVRCAKDGQRIPNFLEAIDRSGRFRIFFTPHKRCHGYQVDVTFNEEQVLGSPFNCKVIDGKKAKASGDGLRNIPAHRQAFFNVDTQGLGEANLHVDIVSPSGQIVPVTQTGSSSAGYHLHYIPVEVGRHKIGIRYADTEIEGSPFTAEVYDPDKVRVGPVPDGIIGKDVVFDVDCRNAGDGTLTVEVVGTNTTAFPHIQSSGNNQFQVSFTPKESGPHNINVTFNGQKVNGSPFISKVHDTSNTSVNWGHVRSVPIRKPVFFEVQTPGGSAQIQPDIKIIDPRGREIPVQVSATAEKFEAEFTPQMVGGHVITVAYGGRGVPGSPNTCYAYDSGQVRIQDASRDLEVGRESSFIIDTTDAGEGDIDVEVMAGDQVVRTQKSKLEHFKHKYTFLPQQAVDHEVNVSFNYEKVPGTPLRIKAIAVVLPPPPPELSVGQTRDNAAVLQSVVSHIKTGGNVINSDAVITRITAPNGEQVPSQIVSQPDGDYKVEYSSRHTGRHTVEILYNGSAIMGSPFYVEIFDPNKIRVEGAKTGSVGEPISFDILCQEAGKAELGLTIRSPTGRTIQYEKHQTIHGEHVTYVPQEQGAHQIFITYGGLDIPGSPMTQGVGSFGGIGGGSGPSGGSDIGGTPRAYGDGLSKGEEGKQASFHVDSQGMKGDLFVQVDGPNSIAKCRIEPEANGKYLVTYTPVEVGTYLVNLKWNNRVVEGSPFHAEIVAPNRIEVIGGWNSFLDQNNTMMLEVNGIRRIELDTGLAGRGAVTAELRGPTGIIPCQIEQIGSRFVVSFTPRSEGEHYLSMWYADIPLPRSPYYGFAGIPRPQVNHDKVIMTGKGLTKAQVHDEAEFIIDGTEAGSGTPTVRLENVTGKADIDVSAIPLGGNKYRCTYTPAIPGSYLLYVKWSDRQVRGSPYKVSVASKSDASKVVCSGEGLKLGIMGKEIKSVIDTRSAGPGELTAHCMGPSKVAMCELADNRDGTYRLNIMPQEAGRHILQVKYEGEHVPGSPYVLKISGAPDASKVRVTGPGVEHGILANYQSRFICDTRGAGAGQLTVRIRGPKGAFRVEMQRESQKDRTILCRYDPTEVGEYMIHIKWSGEHVPGSPFKVQIFDTKEELERYSSESHFRQPENNYYKQGAGSTTMQSYKSWASEL